MEFFALITATLAVSDGILLSTEESARFRLELMEWYTWYMEIREGRIYSVSDILRECVKISRRASSPWDSGSEIALLMGVVMGTLVGTQRPAST